MLAHNFHLNRVDVHLKKELMVKDRNAYSTSTVRQGNIGPVYFRLFRPRHQRENSRFGEYKCH